MADRVLVAISKYYKHISDELEAGALEALEAAGATVTVMEVPGAFELPGLIAIRLCLWRKRPRSDGPDRAASPGDWLRHPDRRE